MNICCLNVSSKMCVKFAPACITHRALQRISNPTLGVIGQCRCSPRGSPLSVKTISQQHVPITRQTLGFDIKRDLREEGGYKKKLCSAAIRGERRQNSLYNKWVQIVMLELQGSAMRPGKWVQEPSRGWTIYVKIMLGSGSELGGVRVWPASPIF